MRKIGIITITGLGNCGNRLQNYALQQAIEKVCDCRCETLINKSCRLKGYIKQIIMHRRKGLTKREQAFQQFNDCYVHFSDIRINNITRDNHLREYACLVCGSDQIWNSDYPENDRANFGYFFSEQQVISYAASFGTNTIAKNKKSRYAKYLKRMKTISVREEKGKELAQGLTGRSDIFVHIDPTLLLTAEEWMQIEKKPGMYHGERFVLKYFLGEKNGEVNEKLEEYAAQNGLTIIDVISPDSPYYNIGPSEFLYLERNAELIVTDSFHSCVFSMIFKRPFIVVDRNDHGMQSMGSRLDTLLGKFGLERRKYQTESFGRLASEPIDYSIVKDILETEKNISYQYLRRELN